MVVITIIRASGWLCKQNGLKSNPKDTPGRIFLLDNKAVKIKIVSHVSY